MFATQRSISNYFKEVCIWWWWWC